METNNKFWFLRNHSLFKHLNDSEVDELCIISAFKTGKKAEVIYFFDREIERIYILKRGRMKVSYYNESDVEVISEILMEGDIFGQLTLENSSNNNKEFAQVLSQEVSICSFLLSDFKNLLQKKPELALEYSQKVGLKLKVIGARYADLIFKDVRTRVIDFFKTSAKFEGRWEGKKVEISMILSQQDIANYIASSRQTVSTVINELIKEKKIIYLSRKKVIIPNIDELDA